MLLEDRIKAFEKIGNIFSNFQINNIFQTSIQKAELENSWFTQSNIEYCLLALSKMLNANQLRKWSSLYIMNDTPKTVGVIIPSNIPLVGFYDFLCVLLSDNIFIGKLSSSNTILLPFVAEILCDINPEFRSRIFFQNNIHDVDLLIATGNDNSADYFSYLFQNKSKIIRYNRNSIAILNGSEKDQDYKKLANDVFIYFGLGCRNVSKLLVPESFDFNRLKSVFQNTFTIKHQPYLDNYNYQKAILNMNSENFLDFDNLLIVESEKINSPVSVLYYQYYKSIESLNKILDNNRGAIQCVVGDNNVSDNMVNFGEAQVPLVFNPPDNLDVMSFLTSD